MECIYAESRLFAYVCSSKVDKYLVVRVDGQQRWVLQVQPEALLAFDNPQPSYPVMHDHALLLKATVRHLFTSRSRFSRRRGLIVGLRGDVFRRMFGEQPAGRQLIPYTPDRFPAPFFNPSVLSFTSPAGTTYFSEVALRWRLSPTPPTSYSQDGTTFLPVPYSIL